MVGITLPVETFESYAGDEAALALVYDVLGSGILDNTPGHPHAGAWCATFDGVTLVYPKGAWSGVGSGLAEQVFDNTFYLAHDAGHFPFMGPSFAAEKEVFFLVRGDNSDTRLAPAFTISVGGWNCGITGYDGDRYRTPEGSLPGDGAYRKVRVYLELDRNTMHPAGQGVARIWIDDVLQMETLTANLSQNLLGGAYQGTYGGIVFSESGGAGFSYFRLDDINVVPVVARARCWEVC
jgi:hypothetical protein